MILLDFHDFDEMLLFNIDLLNSNKRILSGPLARNVDRDRSFKSDGSFEDGSFI